jgi:hypothetical protein
VRAAKPVALILGAYVALVVAFESLIGTFQPAGEGTIVMTTTDADGNSHDRVLSRLQSGGHLYVAANHWPRAWFEQALQNPDVAITVDRERKAYRAVPVSGEEHERVNAENDLGLGIRFLTGFPPRYFIRLDPR